MKPVVAVVGRPNVGKSTLFNRLIQRRLAIVEDTPGVTRDRIYSDAEWNGKVFTLVDTGGLVMGEGAEMAKAIRKQAELAIAEADLVLFLVDGQTGVTGEDRDVADMLRRARVKVLLIVNKVDNPAQAAAVVADFYALGLGDPMPVSAAQGINTGDVLDQILALLPEMSQPGVEEAPISVAVVGRPNVGKSSLVNALLGEERMITSPKPGTTRDAIDTLLEKDGRRFLLVDTAGMRRRARVADAVERYSVQRGLRAIDNANVVLLVLDATREIAEQDRKIAGYAHEQGKAIVIAFNKWDLVEKDTHTMEEYRQNCQWQLSFLGYAPLLFLSARTGQRLPQLLDLLAMVDERHRRSVQTSILNQVIQDAVIVNPPPSERGRGLKIYYATQSGVRPPTVTFFVNDPQLVHFSYQRYLENRLREAFDLQGTPLWLKFRRRRR